MDVLFLIIGLVILLVSGEALVKGAVAIAVRWEVSTLVIGMTIVSVGTSAPELLVSMKAALTDHSDISIGNVIGSNISNLGLVLGITALIFPISVEEDTLRIDWPVMMSASLLFFLLVLDGKLVHWEGTLLFLCLIAYIIFIIRRSRKKNRSAKAALVEEEDLVPMPYFKSGGLILLGCAGLAWGSDWFLEGAVGIAETLGVSEHVIAVTLVAFGTSVPELFTSTIAAFKKETNISVGNLIGSNLFNILSILGLTTIVTNVDINERVLREDIFWMLGISLLILPLMLIRKKLGRVDGFILLFSYCAYVYFIIFQSAL